MTTTPKKRKRGLPVKPEALRLMEEKMREKGFKFTTQERMYEELAEKAGLSPDTIKNVFNPHHERNPEKNTVQLIASALDLYPWDIVEDWNPPESSSRVKYTSSKVYILNRQIFQEMLDKQRSLTANPLVNKNFEVSRLYVPLGLVESKKQERRKDVSPEMGSRLYRPEEYEVTRQFENDEFLTEVLLQGNSPKSQGKRIAIIGEPGSGKTTRLQQIADRLFKENNDNLVILISLADLQDKNLDDFLLNTWLKIALKQKEASKESQNELIEKFNKGNVWLLLDGLDEIVIDSNPLFWVNSQIKGWIESAKVILTCRVNVWESGNNYLSNFDIYRNLDFSEPQRDEFIYKWFTDRNLADQLITELNRDGKERIRDLVKNPLRLTLVCYSWENHQGSLPETKAGLYQECVEAFYQWKEVYFKTTIAQRKALNQALGELAKQALEQESSKFRLTKSFISDVLGESDEGLFKLALDLGWLNRVGVAEENPNEQVYAFFHPSFQEYFVAYSITDWDFFLPRDHIDQPVEGKVYRIFQFQWKQIFLLWLGRSDREITNLEKDKFIEKLVNFEDHTCDFYSAKTYFLAASGIAEFRNCLIADQIINNLIIFSFGSFEGKAIAPIADNAKKTLLETDSLRLAPCLKEFLCSLVEKYNENKSSTVFSLITEVAFFLAQIDYTDEYPIDILIDFPNEKSIKYLTIIAQRNPRIIENSRLKDLFENSRNEFWQPAAALIFSEIKKYQQKAVEKLQILRTSVDIDESIREWISILLSEKNYNTNSINKNSQSRFSFVRETNPIKLINLMKLSTNHVGFFAAFMNFKEIISRSSVKYQLKKKIFIFAIQSVKSNFNSNSYKLMSLNSKLVYELLWYCSENLSYPEFYKAWHNQHKIIHPEIIEISPLGNTTIAQNLNQQILDLPSQLQPTEKTYPLIINAQSLEDENDNSSIAQELCNQIYAIAFPDDNIPEINNAPQLKRLIPTIKKQLKTKNLALIFYNGEPNETLIKFCKKLTAPIHIKWITEQSIKIGIPPQENLVNILQNWINQLD